MAKKKKIKPAKLAEHPITLKFKEQGKDDWFTGLKVTWLSGTHKRRKFELTAGAGVGNSFLVFHYRDKGYMVDVKEIVTTLILLIDKKK